jgi:Family of unknown function (DUF6314)
VSSIRHQVGADHPPLARGTAGEGSTVDFLAGDWNVVRHISDHRTGEVGEFRGQASFQRCAAGLAEQTAPAGQRNRADPGGLALSYREHGELRFAGHCGPASRSLLYRDLGDGGADVRFADGREFYRLDLRSGTWSAEHPCRADHYLVTVRRLSPDSFCETWRVTGPAKDYQLVTTYTRTGRPR